MKANLFSKIFISVLLIISNDSLDCQVNLVANPSFEDTVNCPFGGWINQADQWYSANTYSPDYFNNCVPSSGPGYSYSVPDNWYGSQSARTGDSYAGIITSFFLSGGSLREYVQSELIDSLQPGKRYIASLYVCLVDSSNYAVNDIGLLFTPNQIIGTNDLNLPYNPQVANNSNSNPLIVKNIWILVTDTFLAQGGEKYITIGNFMDDSNTDTVNVNGNSSLQYVYYYIDDVSVVLLDSLAGLNLEDYADVIAYPNPSNGLISLNPSMKIIELEMLDGMGRVLLNKRDNNYLFEIMIDTFVDGIYFLKLKDSQNRTITKKIILKK